MHMAMRFPQNHLTSCLRTVLDSVPQAEDFRWLKLFLLAGAETYSLELAKRMKTAVIADDWDTVALMVDHGTPIASPGHNALEAAILRSDKRMIHRLFQSKTIPAAVGDLVPLLRNSFSPEDQIQTTQWLLDKGAAGTGIHTTFARNPREIHSDGAWK